MAEKLMKNQLINDESNKLTRNNNENDNNSPSSTPKLDISNEDAEKDQFQVDFNIQLSETSLQNINDQYEEYRLTAKTLMYLIGKPNLIQR